MRGGPGRMFKGPSVISSGLFMPSVLYNKGAFTETTIPKTLDLNIFRRHVEKVVLAGEIPMPALLKSV